MQFSNKLVKASFLTNFYKIDFFFLSCIEQRNRGTEEQRNGGTEERRNGGTEERRNGGTEERRNRGTEERQILGYFVMFIFSFYVNLVSAGLREQHLKTYAKWSGILQSSHCINSSLSRAL